MKRLCVLLCIAGVIGVSGFVAGIGAASSSSSARNSRAPVWLSHPDTVIPGASVAFVLDPAGAAVCWIGLHGPASGQDIGWRFQVNSQRLSLTLLTRADATPGRWTLSASCPRAGDTSRTADVTVNVPPGLLVQRAVPRQGMGCLPRTATPARSCFGQRLPVRARSMSKGSLSHSGS